MIIMYISLYKLTNTHARGVSHTRDRILPYIHIINWEAMNNFSCISLILNRMIMGKFIMFFVFY